MSVEKVNGISKVSFGERAKVQPGKDKKTPEQIKDGKKKLAMALGALAVAGAVTAGVVAVKKGKLNNSQIKNAIKESADDIGNAVKNSADDVNNAAKNVIKESADVISNAVKNSADDVNNAAKDYFNSFDDFKKIGTFDKGKALIDGKGFSGVIQHIGKDGQIKHVKYKNGLLMSVSDSLYTKYPEKFFDGRKGYALYDDGLNCVEQKLFSYDPATKTVIQELYRAESPNLRTLYIFDRHNPQAIIINTDKKTGTSHITQGNRQIEVRDLPKNILTAVQNHVLKYVSYM